MGVELSVYHGGLGKEYDAIYLRWSEVAAILGHDYQGDPEDDEKLIEYLLAQGAPDWVRDADGWIDQGGWGLIGPERPG